MLIIPEISELKGRRLGIPIVPTYPREAVLHDDAKALLGDGVFSASALGRPRESGRETVREERYGGGQDLGRLFRGRSAGVLLRNLAVYPKGFLWLADIARFWSADHIHARGRSADCLSARNKDG